MRNERGSKKQDYRTPDSVLADVARFGTIALDPCADNNPANHYARINVTKAGNGLAADWAALIHAAGCTDGIAFANHEYGLAIPTWVAKCAQEARQGTEIVQLTPARPSSGWYFDLKANASAICELRGRLTFKGAKDGAMFPSTLTYYGPRKYLFAHLFDSKGDVRVLR